MNSDFSAQMSDLFERYDYVLVLFAVQHKMSLAHSKDVINRFGVIEGKYIIMMRCGFAFKHDFKRDVLDEIDKWTDVSEECKDFLKTSATRTFSKYKI